MSCEGKIIVISAPSGTGKSTIINAISKKGDIDMKFSVSATNRGPRSGEVDGVNYHFLTTETFKEKIAEDAFVEWEEVYPGRYYGTLKSEIERTCKSGHNVILDIDVKGALNVKRIFGDKALTLFIQPPSVDALKLRLEARGTETAESLNQRISKAEYELSFAPQFDCSVVNDNLDTAIRDTESLIKTFLESH